MTAPLAEPTSRTERLLGTAKALPAVAFLGGSLLGFNAAQTASLALLPVSRRRFRAFNRWAAGRFWGWCVEVSERLHGIGVVYSGDDIPPGEKAIVVANHQQMPDITFLMFLARDKGRLADMKWMLKDVIKYVPGIGWGMLFFENLFVKRNWTADQAAIDRTFAGIKRNDVPLWLMMFVEGTRATPEKLEQSRRYAESKGLPPTEHVLLPRTKGFVASVQALREHLDAVYDVTIGYPEGVPDLWQYARGLARRAHLHLRRWPIATLPADDAALADWLQARFSEKDELLEHFERNGRFPPAGTATAVQHRGRADPAPERRSTD
jgi:1-acyl-sn-glycerol-3-phosphate acyltransferase